MRGRHFLGWLIQLILAGVLLYAAFMKGLDPLLFADQIASHEVGPLTWALPLAYLFIAVELLLGFGLILRLWPRVTNSAFILLMLFFVVVTTIAWAHGNTEDCGCFGRTAGQGPLPVIIRDVVLIILSGIALWLLRTAKTHRFSLVTLIILLPLIGAFTALGSRLPADSLVTGIRDGTEFPDLPVELRPPINEGTILLILVEDDCLSCVEALPRLNEIVSTFRGGIRVAALFSGQKPQRGAREDIGRQAMAWRMKHLPAFPVVAVPWRVLRAYYRNLPACILLDEGRVVRTYWGRVPTASDLQVIDYD